MGTQSSKKSTTRTQRLVSRMKVGSYWKHSWGRGFRYIHWTGPVSARGYENDSINGAHVSAFVPFPEARLGTPCIESGDGKVAPMGFVGFTVPGTRWAKGTKLMFEFWKNYCHG